MKGKREAEVFAVDRSKAPKAQLERNASELPAEGVEFLGVVKKGWREAEVFAVDRAPAVVRPRSRKT
jgi:hypothetical protein